MLIGLSWARSFAERFAHYVDGFRAFPGYRGLPEQLIDVHKIPLFLQAIQAERFDLVLQMHGNGQITIPLVMAFGARRIAGFFSEGNYCPDREFFLPYPAHEPEIWRHYRHAPSGGRPERVAGSRHLLQRLDV
jgi:hypothetical protein